MIDLVLVVVCIFHKHILSWIYFSLEIIEINSDCVHILSSGVDLHAAVSSCRKLSNTQMLRTLVMKNSLRVLSVFSS